MTSHASAMKRRQSTSEQHYELAARAVLEIAGLLFSLLGAVIAVGGLLTPVGSAFHMLAGSGLILSGTLVAKRHRAGAWFYLAVFAVTLIWSLRDVGLSGAPLATRLIGPVTLLGMIALLMPLLRGWSPRKTTTAFTALLIITIGLGVTSNAVAPIGRSTMAVAHLLGVQTSGVRI